jgi:outer membrane protein assembly factor BamD
MAAMKRSVILGTFALALLCSACGAKKIRSAEEYHRLASDHFRSGAYEAAAEQYRELLDQHPFSEHSDEAELRIAQAHYMSGACAEAVAAFTDFQRRHPTSPELPLVGYLIGQCYERQMRPADRDQSASQSAHAFYNAVSQQYPDSPYADLARSRIEYCRELLAEHEMAVARFYLRQKNRKAGEVRLLDLVNSFNDTDAAGEALFQLGQIYRQNGDTERAVLAFASVAYHHPDNEVARQALRALDRLASEGEVPAGDPLAALRLESGRSRSLAMARVEDVRERTAAEPKRGFSSPPPPAPGFGLPGAGYGPDRF